MHMDPVEREARMSVIEERARALAALHWRTTPKAPLPRSPLDDVID
nr:hypothetical protein [Streptomyces antibioticus]